jgi:hypothetical protein
VKLDQFDKQNIQGVVAQPFFVLAKKIDGKTTKKLALKVFREDIVPAFVKVRELFPDFWGRLDPASYFVYEIPPTPPIHTGRYYASNRADNTMEIPADLKELAIPCLNGITKANSYGSRHGSVEVTQERMRAKASDADRETIQKAHDLRVKGSRVKELLEQFLQDFTMPEQIPYSLPQLNYFMQELDFRKRNRYSTKPAMAAQKRPKVVVVPPAELRQLVVEATLLHQSMKKEIEEE